MPGQSVHRMLLSRRSFLVGAVLASTLPANAFQSDGEGVLGVVRGMRGIGGSENAPVQILVSPGCMKGNELLRDVTSFVPAEMVRWVPFGWRASDDGGVAELLRRGPGGLSAFLAEGVDPASDRPAELEAAVAQRETFDREIFMRLVRATGRSPAAPTMIVSAGGEDRIYRGAPSAQTIREISYDLRIEKLLVR